LRGLVRHFTIYESGGMNENEYQITVPGWISGFTSGGACVADACPRREEGRKGGESGKVREGESAESLGRHWLARHRKKLHDCGHERWEASHAGLQPENQGDGVKRNSSKNGRYRPWRFGCG